MSSWLALLFPVWLLFAALLNSIHELEQNRHSDQQDVIKAVEAAQLQGRRHIFLDQVMEHVKLDQHTTVVLLGQLRRSGELVWTDSGYRRARRS